MLVFMGELAELPLFHLALIHAPLTGFMVNSFSLLLLFADVILCGVISTGLLIVLFKGIHLAHIPCIHDLVMRVMTILFQIPLAMTLQYDLFVLLVLT